MALVEEIYRITNNFPTEERFGLSNQLRRAAVSIPSNIAEGAARNGKKEFAQFLYVALGSISEIETQIELAFRLQFLRDPQSLGEQITEIRRMLLGRISPLSNKK